MRCADRPSQRPWRQATSSGAMALKGALELLECRARDGRRDNLRHRSQRNEGCARPPPRWRSRCKACHWSDGCISAVPVSTVATAHHRVLAADKNQRPGPSRAFKPAADEQRRPRRLAPSARGLAAFRTNPPGKHSGKQKTHVSRQE